MLQKQYEIECVARKGEKRDPATDQGSWRLQVSGFVSRVPVDAHAAKWTVCLTAHPTSLSYRDRRFEIGPRCRKSVLHYDNTRAKVFLWIVGSKIVHNDESMCFAGELGDQE